MPDTAAFYDLTGKVYGDGATDDRQFFRAAHGNKFRCTIEHNTEDFMTKEFEIDTEKKVCVNCQYMQRPLGRNPDDTYPCSFWHKMIENVQGASCQNWRKWDISSLI